MAIPIRITYDPDGHILSVTFGAPTSATGYQLCDQILVRVNPDSREAAGLTILNFSVHARSGAPIALRELPAKGAVSADVVALLASAPVNRFLHFSQDDKGPHVTVLQPALAEAVAA